jgi:hypothetical protein
MAHLVGFLTHHTFIYRWLFFELNNRKNTIKEKKQC